MLDLKLVRHDPDAVQTALARRHGNDEKQIAEILTLDEQRRKLVTESDQLKADLNRVSKEIGKSKDSEDSKQKIQNSRLLGERISSLDAQIATTDEKLQNILLHLPALPHSTVPEGSGPPDNKLIRSHGEKPHYSFTPKPHWEIGEKLGILDFQRATKISGSGFFILKGLGAKLERALISFMLDLHTHEHGYTELWPPTLVNRASMLNTGKLPKFEEELYRCKDDELYLIPTAEVPLTDLHRDEILSEKELPKYYTAYTPCYRREAGAAGKQTRGMLRVHQFDKVELVKLATPETSYNELEKMLQNAEKVLQLLGLHYHILELCTGDLGFASTKTYDIEVWAAGQNAYLEVSSVSNCEDFQSRRANIRYKTKDGKNRFVHTLNGSGVALPRLVIALLENGQQADGHVKLPDSLVPYMGTDKI